MLDYLLSFVFLIIGNYLGESPLQVERLLSAEQKVTDYRSPDDGMTPDHRPTNACTRFVLLVNFCGVIRNSMDVKVIGFRTLEMVQVLCL